MSTEESPPRCYLDHAAATPLLPEVAAAMQGAWETFGNPSSPHAAGREARRTLEEARERILAVLGGRARGPHRDRLVFTSGATEANQMAIAGLKTPQGVPPVVLHSARDHAGTRAAAGHLATTGRDVLEIPLDKLGLLDQDALAIAASGDAAAVLSTTLACSQSGTLEDVAAITARFPQLLLHVDAAQAVGRVPVNFESLGAAAMALAAHKLGGPRGIGGLLLRGEAAITPLLPGTQERDLRGGTEPVALAVGFATAVELAVQRQAAEAERLAGLRERLEHTLRQHLAAAGLELLVIGGTVLRAPHISVIALPGRDRQATVMAADLAGLCLASGTACASGSSEPSPALVAATLPAAVVASAVRLSLGWSTTAADIDRAVGILRRVFAAAAS